MVSRQRVVFQPDAYLRMQQGIHQMVAPIAATLGPLAGTVVFGGGMAADQPEVLDSGGLIARRIIELRDPDADMGAMFVRHLITRLHSTVGDATATAAVLFQVVFDEGVKYLAAGGNPTALRRHLEAGADCIVNTLSDMVCQLEGKEQLAQIAESICHDPPLAQMLGEIFEIIGDHGQLEIRINNQRGLHREYVEGAYWASGALSRTLLASHQGKRIVLRNPAILISDLEVVDGQNFAKALAAAREAGFKSLLILALKLSDSALGFLAANNAEDFQIVAAQTPGGNLSRVDALEDVAALTGGRLFLKVAGDTLENVQPQDFGTARRAWVDREYFGIVGGGGNPRAFRRHIANLRQAFIRADDPDMRQTLQQRIGRLGGGSVTLRVGGVSESEARQRQALAERTANILRTVVRGGVVPGGGMALLNCQSTLQDALDRDNPVDKRAAYMILLKALEAPARTILHNAGYDAGEVLAGARHVGNGCGYDVVRGQQVNMMEAGIYDPANALKAAVRGAVYSAAQALTVTVLVHCKQPEQVLQPE